MQCTDESFLSSWRSCWARRPARAVIGVLDDVPAATLLLPYFEVDASSPSGTTTLLFLRNASAAPVVAHVTFWSNLAVPVVAFDIYLTGYDQQSLNLRDVLVSGVLPVTGPADFLSPRGDLSDPHDDFGGSCSTTLGKPPAYSNPALSSSFLAHLQAWLSGQPSFILGTCAATETDRLVGYLTIDATNRCAFGFPSEPGYFEPGGSGVASDRNVLWGEWALVDPAGGLAYADSLVHIEASADDPRTTTPGSYTFYGRYLGGSAADNRERLPSEWYAPLEPLAEATGTSELLVWRDPGLGTGFGFPCGTLPGGFPLGSEALSVVGPDGSATPLDAAAFPWATQRVAIGEGGSVAHLDLDTPTGSLFDPAKQAHVIALRTGSSGRLGTGMATVPAAGGVPGAVDAAPGATLLMPFFEVDPEDPDGAGAVFAVRNSAPASVLARVVLWSDLSVPTLGFEVYLPGFGSRIVDLRELFRSGTLPASDPAPLPGCGGRLPPAPLSPDALTGLRAAHAGKPSDLFGGLCAGADHGDSIARGYATVDVVTRCTDALPGEPGYFDTDGPGGDAGAVGFDNVLWGDYVLVDPQNNSAHGDTLVSLQASTSDPVTSTPGAPTFYGRYVGGSAADHREPLPERWGAGQLRGGFFDGGTDLLVWRDTGIVHEPFTCGALPAPFPLDQGPSLQFDETGADQPVPAAAFGLEAERRRADWVGPDFGWLSLDLGASSGGLFEPLLQSYVTGVARANGRFAWSVDGVQLPSASPAATFVTLVASDPEASELPLDPGELAVTRIGPVDAPLDVTLSLGGTATAGADYAPLGPLSFQIPAGETTVRISVIPIADGLDEGAETVVLTLVGAAGATISRPSSATVTIRDVAPGAQPPPTSPDVPALGPGTGALMVLLLLGAGLAILRRAL